MIKIFDGGYTLKSLFRTLSYTSLALAASTNIFFLSGCGEKEDVENHSTEQKPAVEPSPAEPSPATEVPSPTAEPEASPSPEEKKDGDKKEEGKEEHKEGHKEEKKDSKKTETASSSQSATKVRESGDKARNVIREMESLSNEVKKLSDSIDAKSTDVYLKLKPESYKPMVADIEAFADATKKFDNKAGELKKVLKEMDEEVNKLKK